MITTRRFLSSTMGSWRLPPAYLPYAELIRFEKPAGTINLYFPYLYGSIYAACVKEEIPSIDQLLSTALGLLGLSFIIRSIGCTWNDYVDRDLDKHISRCCNRPLARGAIAPGDALTFMACEYAVLFGVIFAGQMSLLPYIVAVIMTGTMYPYAKRVTNYAQTFLGFSLSIGILIGCATTGVDPAEAIVAKSASGLSMLALMLAWVVWTMIYDTIYAFQDLEADKKVGNMALSVRFEQNMHGVFYGLAAAESLCLVAAGWFSGFHVWFYVSVAVLMFSLLDTLVRTDLKDMQQCRWWFEKGSLRIGFGVAGCLGVEYLTRLLL
ncbi:UbiA prenyltransferase family [Nemania sp. FL0916]|nr:UbiA prenyltransferase family [Nemania sp. FL0916]